MNSYSEDIVTNYTIMDGYIAYLEEIIQDTYRISRSISDISITVNDFSKGGTYFGQASEYLVDYADILAANYNQLIGYLGCCKKYMELCEESSRNEEQTLKNTVDNITNVEVNIK